MTSAALRGALDDNVPRSGDGDYPLLGSQRRYAWERGPLDIGFAQGRIVLTTQVRATAFMPIGQVEFPVQVRVDAEPIVSAEGAVKLQSVDVLVTSSDTRLAVANKIAGVYDKIADAVSSRLKAFSYDLRPLLSEAYARVAKPLDLPIGDARGCAELHVLGIEAGPTVLADGIEKDLAIVVAPSVTLPCLHEGSSDDAQLPPLSNVAWVASGPFTVVVPIAARYDELTHAMSAAFTDGKLYFSSEYPQLYLDRPELYESQSQLVLKLHLHGPIHKFGIDAELDGDLYLSGHPAVIDNELRVPDLEPTIETRNFLLSIKALTDSDRIREQARQALRLDIGERLHGVREKLSSDLTFGSASACFRGDVDRIEVTSVHPHAAYLRVYVAVTARTRATLPCPVSPDLDAGRKVH